VEGLRVASRAFVPSRSHSQNPSDLEVLAGSGTFLVGLLVRREERRVLGDQWTAYERYCKKVEPSCFRQRRVQASAGLPTITRRA
jgi:hypothetical protein